MGLYQIKKFVHVKRNSYQAQLPASTWAPPPFLCISFPYILISPLYTHVSCHEFFPAEYEEFGIHRLH
jgi:hypothetical protein